MNPKLDLIQVSPTLAPSSLRNRPRRTRKRLRFTSISTADIPDSDFSDIQTAVSRRLRAAKSKRKRNIESEPSEITFESAAQPQERNATKEPENTNEHEEGTSLNSGTSQNNFSCPECGKIYTTASNLTRHRQTHRNLSDRKARKCPHCDRVYVYVSSPAYNMVTKFFECPR